MSTVTLDRPRTNTPGPTDQQVQAYLRTGLRNRWWPVLPSRFVEASESRLGSRGSANVWCSGAMPRASFTFIMTAARTAPCRCHAASTKATDCAATITASKSVPMAGCLTCPASLAVRSKVRRR